MDGPTRVLSLARFLVARPVLATPTFGASKRNLPGRTARPTLAIYGRAKTEAGMTGADTLLWLVHAASTLFMLGVIAVIQWVHYPLFARVGVAGFPAYASEHGRRITWVVAGPMLVELATAIWLVFRPLPPGVPGWMAWAGLVAVLVLWGSTFLLQVPQHEALRVGFDPEAHRRLVSSNWLRTVLWALRGVWVLYLLARAIGREC